jgi:DNA-binding NarL/FixJ family response regulator
MLAPLPAIEIVGTFYSAREAVEMADRLNPDLILIDLVMPDMSGLEATRLLAGQPSAPLVVIMSVHDDETYREASFRSGADDFLPKSELSDRLLPMIERLMPGRRSAIEARGLLENESAPAPSTAETKPPDEVEERN